MNSSSNLLVLGATGQEENSSQNIYKGVQQTFRSDREGKKI